MFLNYTCIIPPKFIHDTLEQAEAAVRELLEKASNGSLKSEGPDKGKVVSARHQGGGGEREGARWVVREGAGAGGRNDPSIVCTYE
jgi:hypothetical protein